MFRGQKKTLWMATGFVHPTCKGVKVNVINDRLVIAVLGRLKCRLVITYQCFV